MEKLYNLSMKMANILLYLPESFEWLILDSGLIPGKNLKGILSEPEQYIESREYFSWERFFTRLLIHETEDTYFKYQKNRLNPVYLHEKSKQSILSAMGDILS